MHLEARDPKLNKWNRMPPLISMQKLPKSSRFQIASLKALLQKASEKLKTQEAPKPKMMD